MVNWIEVWFLIYTNIRPLEISFLEHVGDGNKIPNDCIECKLFIAWLAEIIDSGIIFQPNQL